MKKQLLFAMMLLSAVLPLGAATVSIGHYIANPGARIAVPVEIDSTEGIASAAVTVTYNPEVLRLKGVRRGELKRLFDFDFSVMRSPGRVEFLAASLKDITEAASGSLAELLFEVREGTAGLYSDLTLADVQLAEASMTKDLTPDGTSSAEAMALAASGAEAADSPIANGMVRIFAPTAEVNTDVRTKKPTAQQTAPEYVPVTLAADTVLKSFTLQAGDRFRVSDSGTPIILTDGLNIGDKVTQSTNKLPEVTLLPPLRGWKNASYTVLKTGSPKQPAPAAQTMGLIPHEPNTTATLDFAVADAPEAMTMKEETADGVTTYALDSKIVTLAKLSTGETIAPGSKLEAVLKSQADGGTTVRLSENAQALSVDVLNSLVSLFDKVLVEKSPAQTFGIMALAETPTEKELDVDYQFGVNRLQMVTLDDKPYVVIEAKLASASGKAAFATGTSVELRVVHNAGQGPRAVPVEIAEVSDITGVTSGTAADDSEHLRYFRVPYDSLKEVGTYRFSVRAVRK